ncbi:hypothetical protein ON010_g13676 [Phytophthora cinnamomi]|nr:hypothetical protein ON010_g13676 [Phytophthora cinnamomi]
MEPPVVAPTRARTDVGGAPLPIRYLRWDIVARWQRLRWRRARRVAVLSAERSASAAASLSISFELAASLAVRSQIEPSVAVARLRGSTPAPSQRDMQRAVPPRVKIPERHLLQLGALLVKRAWTSAGERRGRQQPASDTGQGVGWQIAVASAKLPCGASNAGGHHHAALRLEAHIHRSLPAAAARLLGSPAWAACSLPSPMCRCAFLSPGASRWTVEGHRRTISVMLQSKAPPQFAPGRRDGAAQVAPAAERGPRERPAAPVRARGLLQGRVRRQGLERSCGQGGGHQHVGAQEEGARPPIGCLGVGVGVMVAYSIIVAVAVAVADVAAARHGDRHGPVQEPAADGLHDVDERQLHQHLQHHDHGHDHHEHGQVALQHEQRFRAGERRRDRPDAAQGRVHGRQSGGRGHGRVQVLQHGAATHDKRRLDVAAADQAGGGDLVVRAQLQSVAHTDWIGEAASLRGDVS